MDEGNHLAQITKRLKSSSAVVPALLLTLICTPTGVFASKFYEPPLNYIFVALAILPPVLTALQIAFFTIWDRDRLHNEDHVERKMLIRKASAEIGDRSVTIEMKPNQELIENPSAQGSDDV